MHSQDLFYPLRTFSYNSGIFIWFGYIHRLTLTINPLNTALMLTNSILANSSCHRILFLDSMQFNVDVR